MSEDTEAREVFKVLRGAPEPMWHPDVDAFADTGRRRTRSRNLAVAAGAVTLSTAVALAAVLGSGGRQAAGPATTPTPTPRPSADRQYVFFGTMSWKPDKEWLSGPIPSTVVPDTAADDAMTIVTRLDPGLRHLVKATASNHVLPNGDPAFKKAAYLIGHTEWTPTGAPSKQGGKLTIGFKDSPKTSGPSGRVGCGADIEAYDTQLDPVPGVPDGAKWSSCTRVPLADGSVLLSSSKSYGSYEILAAERDFPNDGGTVSLVWQNFLAQSPLDPYPDSILSPSPITAAQLAAALSGPEIRPALGTSGQSSSAP